MMIGFFVLAVAVELVDPMIGAVAYPESGLRGDEAIHGFGKTFPGAATPSRARRTSTSPTSRTSSRSGSSTRRGT